MGREPCCSLQTKKTTTTSESGEFKATNAPPGMKQSRNNCVVSKDRKALHPDWTFTGEAQSIDENGISARPSDWPDTLGFCQFKVKIRNLK
ncbi:hypothetical protein NPIL_65571 [Nephila pilipes]|uniref:Uncharacterized protein n=1 Tax=Nephila pilipes TaxID=299642 RepID=A0A8X6IW92_NEPPI|nr:hypothetical protein NPIL_65571 [Nephila pilipes]